MPNLEQLAEKSGADGFLEKPFNISVLASMIRSFDKSKE